VIYPNGEAAEIRERLPGDTVNLPRRHFLKLAGAAVAASFIAPFHGDATPSAISESAWKDLSAKVKGGVLRPGDPGFAALARPQNLRYEGIAPIGIARPRDAAETIAAIAWARASGTPMALRSGGHSYAGCSTVAGLIIHTGRMRDVRHLGNGIVEIAGGALNGDIYRVLAGAKAAVGGDGLAATHGRCMGVGASGFLLGGGIGFAMRDRGLGCDLVQAIEVALPDGQVVRASDNENADLFWALRGGGGGNLGVSLSFTLRAVQAEPMTSFRLAWHHKVEDVFFRLARSLESAPERMGAKLSVEATRKGSTRPNTLLLIGQLRGPHDEMRAILAPAFAVAAPSTSTVQTTPYWQAQKFLSEEGPPARYQETSRYCGTLNEQMVEEVFRRVRAWPGTGADAVFKMFHVGGRIRTVPAAATAYVHREAEWLTGTELNWTAADKAAVVEANLAWQRDFHEACAILMPEGGSYQNFTDPGLADPATAYYGANLGRLREIKRRIDPDGIFSPPRRQGIDPAT
jgi:FAD/FMN-containing dehydrogenase